MKTYPILLVHGIDDTSLRMRPMHTALLLRGFRPVHAMDIVPADASISIEAMGEQVRSAVHTLHRTTQAKKVDIVGFSMGALAARYFVQRQGGQSMVRRFVSIAGPHHGTYTAYFRQTEGCCQMRPGSPIIRDLNHETDPWGGVEAFSFWSPLDLMIIPATSSRLDRAHNRAFAVPLHPWMASNQQVIEAVVQTLAEPE